MPFTPAGKTVLTIDTPSANKAVGNTVVVSGSYSLPIGVSPQAIVSGVGPVRVAVQVGEGGPWTEQFK